jgi:hypothetical protein
MDAEEQKSLGRLINTLLTMADDPNDPPDQEDVDELRAEVEQAEAALRNVRQRVEGLAPPD